MRQRPCGVAFVLLGLALLLWAAAAVGCTYTGDLGLVRYINQAQAERIRILEETNAELVAEIERLQQPPDVVEVLPEPIPEPEPVAFAGDLKTLATAGVPAVILLLAVVGRVAGWLPK